MRVFVEGKRGDIGFNYIFAIILVVIAFIFIMLFVLKVDIVQYIKLLPQYKDSGGNDKILPEEIGKDETADGEECVVTADVRKPEGGNFKVTNVQFLYVTNERTELYISGNEIKLNVPWALDPVVGEIARDKFVIYKDFLDPLRSYDDYSDTLPSLGVLKVLDGSVKAKGDNRYCKTYEEIGNVNDLITKESKIIELTFTSFIDDELKVKWVFGKGSAIVIRPNGDRILLDNFDDDLEGIPSKEEFWIFSDYNDLLERTRTRAENPSLWMTQENWDDMKKLIGAKSPADLSIKVWTLAARDNILVNGMDDVDSLAEMNQLFYGRDKAPEDPDYNLEG